MSPPAAGRSPNLRATLLTLYAHPFELAVAVMLGVSALRSGIDPAALSDVLDPTVVALWVVANAVGILGIVAGLFGSADVTGDQPRRRAFYRGLEKAGLYIVAGTTSAITVALLAGLPFGRAWSPAAQLAAIAVACVLRAGAIRKAERIELEQLRRLSSTEYLTRLLGGEEADDREDGRP